jgi:hypothetical protein
VNEVENKAPTPDRHFEALADAIVRMVERRRFLVELREQRRQERRRKRQQQKEEAAA